MLKVDPYSLDAERAPASSHPVTDRDSVARLRTLHVLVVEDDPADLALIERALRRMTSFEPHITATGTVEAARRALKLASFDLALVDQTLDDASGLNLLPSAGAEVLGCPAILVTGLLTSDLRHAAIERGFAACVEKDELTPRILEALIRQALVVFELQDRIARLEATQPGKRSPAAAITPDVCDLQALLIDAVSELQSRPDIEEQHQLLIGLSLGAAPLLVEGSDVELLKEIESKLLAWLFGRRTGTAVNLRIDRDDHEARIIVVDGPAEHTPLSWQAAAGEADAVILATLARRPLARRRRRLS